MICKTINKFIKVVKTQKNNSQKPLLPPRPAKSCTKPGSARRVYRGMRAKEFNKLILSLFFLISFFNTTHTTDFLITHSGNYELGTNITSSGDPNGTILIQASYVTLDLNEYSVIQTTATASCNGIVIAPGVTNVTIQNGTLLGFTRAGVLAQAGCSVITLQNLDFANCQTRGIDFSGTFTGTGGSNITASQINNCNFIGCFSNASSDFGINLSNCQSVLVSGCTFNNNTTNSSSFSFIGLTDSNSCSLKNIDISENTGGGSTGNLYAIQLTTVSSLCSNNIISDVSIRNNLINAGVSYGIALNSLSANTCSQNFIENCQFLGNTVPVDFTCFNLQYSSNNFVRNCVAQGNIATSSSSGAFVSLIGNSSASPASSGLTAGNVFEDCVISGNTCFLNAFYISASALNSVLRCLITNNQRLSPGLVVVGTLSYSNFISDCLISGNLHTTTFYGIQIAQAQANDITSCRIESNTAQGQVFIGIYLSSGAANSTGNNISNCVIKSNTAATSLQQAYGIYLDASSSSNVISGCMVSQNAATVDANSYGIYTLNSNNIFTQNISYANGVTTPLIANQLFGLPVGSMMTPGGGGGVSPSSRVSSAMSPWTNLRIAS